MTESRQSNAFAAFGTVATGDRFVGRESELNRLRDRVASGGGSTAIVGVARIGKSSLAAQVLHGLDPSAAATEWINLSTYSDGTDFFDFLAERVAATSLDSSSGIYKAFRRLSQLLQTRRDVQRVIVIDEFDRVRKFRDAADFMRLLRELLYDPTRTRLTAIICSRREVANLELETMDVSTLAGVLDHVSLRPFTPAEFCVLTERSPVGVSPEMSEAILRVAGGHPYLSEMCLDRGLAADDDEADISEVLLASSSRYFEHLTEFLANEKLLAEAIQTVVGPRVTTDRAANSQLLRYGIVIDQSRAFSDEYTEWLNLAALDTDLWGLFGKVEEALRSMIESVLTEKIGSGWLEVLAQRHRAVKVLVEESTRLRTLDAKKFPGAETQSLLRYTYPAQLRDILQAEWPHFKPILGHDQQYWRPRLDLLARVRAPFAHSRGDVVPEPDVRLAELYCQEILRLLAQASVGREPSDEAL